MDDDNIAVVKLFLISVVVLTFGLRHAMRTYDRLHYLPPAQRFGCAILTGAAIYPIGLEVGAMAYRVYSVLQSPFSLGPDSVSFVFRPIFDVSWFPWLIILSAVATIAVIVPTVTIYAFGLRQRDRANTANQDY